MTLQTLKVQSWYLAVKSKYDDSFRRFNLHCARRSSLFSNTKSNRRFSWRSYAVRHTNFLNKLNRYRGHRAVQFDAICCVHNPD